MSEPRRDGYLPGAHAIDGFGRGGFQFAGMSHRGSILATPSAVRAWDVTRVDALDAQALAPLLAEEAASIELVLIGSGETLQPAPKAALALLREKGWRIDVMATRHAVATYNILLGEKRRVGAALIAAP